MMHVPVSRAKELLYLNGELDPRLCQLEVDLHQRRPSLEIWIGYIIADQVVTEGVSSWEECQIKMAELNGLGQVTGFIVVDKRIC
jgi:hypothetical protein